MAKLAGLFPPIALIISLLPIGLVAAQTNPAPTIVSVPALGVQTDGMTGFVNYILIQFDRTAAQEGPTVEFNEINFGGGSRVGDEWKEGMLRAVQAVTLAVGDEGRDWLITIKNRSVTAFTDGTSAGAVVAVGIMAAYFGDPIREDTALSGQVTADGRLDVVGGLPVKIEAAAAAHYKTVVIPRDQNQMPDWTATNDAASRKRVQLISVGTLKEAYEAMTGKIR